MALKKPLITRYNKNNNNQCAVRDRNRNKISISVSNRNRMVREEVCYKSLCITDVLWHLLSVILALYFQFIANDVEAYITASKWLTY